MAAKGKNTRKKVQSVEKIQPEITEKQPEVEKIQPEITEKQPEVEKIQPEITEKPVKVKEKPVKVKEKTAKKEVSKEVTPKYKVGSIVFISNEADADLNGFKLFPQYKKYTYTVEAYNQISGVYTLRRLNLSIRLSENFILAPEERAHDALHRRQF